MYLDLKRNDLKHRYEFVRTVLLNYQRLILYIARRNWAPYSKCRALSSLCCEEIAWLVSLKPIWALTNSVINCSVPKRLHRHSSQKKMRTMSLYKIEVVYNCTSQFIIVSCIIFEFALCHIMWVLLTLKPTFYLYLRYTVVWHINRLRFIS